MIICRIEFLNFRPVVADYQGYESSIVQSRVINELLLISPICALFLRYPRINRESMLPVATDNSSTGFNAEAWYPPGHGDIYASFYNSGLLDIFLEQGKEYMFVSNIDNLGATVDLNILHHLLNPPSGRQCEFVMEVTDKTRADVKVINCKIRLVFNSNNQIYYFINTKCKY